MSDRATTEFAPLCLDALTARIAEQAGFRSVYVSGGALGYAHAVSEALLGLNELADVVRHIRARSGVEVQSRLPLLSSYLGHLNPTMTYWYLTAVPELLHLVSERCRLSQEVRP